MSEQRPDDPRLDPALRQALRDRATEQPRADVDARILAAARRAVGSRPAATGLRRWLPRIDTPFATAAVVMVSAALLLMMREQGHFEPTALKEIHEPATPTALPAMPASEVAGSNTVAPAGAIPAASIDETAAAAPRNESVAPPAATHETQAPESIAPPGAGVRSRSDGGAVVGSLRQAIEMPPTPPEGKGDPAAPPSAVPAIDGAASATGPVSAFPAVPALEKAKPAPEPSMQDGAAPPAAAKQTAPPIEADKREHHDARKNTNASAAATPTATGSTGADDDGAMAAPDSPVGERRQDAASDGQAGGVVDPAPARSAAATAPPTETAEQKALQAIRELIAAGRFSDARLALARFVKAHPDYHVPADILQALRPAD